jgi:hypothetical protein
MVCWYKANWGAIEPWLSVVQLLDEEMKIIDGGREISETGKKTFPLL